MAQPTIIISAIEFIFTIIKAVLLHLRLGFAAVTAFTIESMAGIALTVILAVGIFRDIPLLDNGIEYIDAIGAVFIGVTDIASVVVEAITVRRKLAGIASEIDGQRGRKRRSVVKWLSFAVTVLLLGFSIYVSVVSLDAPKHYELMGLRPSSGLHDYFVANGIAYRSFLHPNVALGLSIFLFVQVLFVLFIACGCARTFGLRVAFAVLWLFFDVVMSIIILLRTPYEFRQPQRFYNFSTPQIVAVFALTFASMFTCISAFRLSGYKDMGDITEEQAKFVETVFISAAPAIVAFSIFTYVLPDTLLVMLTVVPQIAALFVPLLFEYAAGVPRCIRGY